MRAEGTYTPPTSCRTLGSKCKRYSMSSQATLEEMGFSPESA